MQVTSIAEREDHGDLIVRYFAGGVASPVNMVASMAMSSISIRRPHSLDHSQAVEVANRVSRELAGKYGIETSWSGKSMNVKGSGLRGVLRLAPNQFELDLELGLVLSMFRDKITAGIEAEFDKLIRAKPEKSE